MRKNILIKSMLRQKARTIVLVLLILAASFTFVMRVVEYIVITEKIENIGGFYRSVGVLQYTGAASLHAPVNVFAGAEIVRNSPFVDFEDRRRGVSGVLRDMQNADTLGMNVSFPASVRAQPTDEIYIMGLRHTDIFFYGELISKNFRYDYDFPLGSFIGRPPPNIELTFRADYILSGYAEHWVQGRGENIIMIRYFLPMPLPYYVEYDQAMFDQPPAVANMEIGQRYFLRAGFYWPSIYRNFDMLPVQAGENSEMLVMEPLNTDISIRRRTVPDNPIWYLPVGVDEVVDFASTPGLQNIPDIIERLHHNQREIYVRTTTDMTALPGMQMRTPSLALAEGRWIDHEDYLNANPVAVVHSSFARIRNLELGDTIVIDIPKEQIVVGVSPRTGGDDFDIVTAPGEYLTYELELTIVGIFWDNDPVRVYFFGFLMNNHIYISDSVLPDDFVFSAALTDESMWTAFDAVMEDERSMSDFAAAMFPPGPGAAPYWPLPAIEALGNPDFIPNIWYSFVLNDPRDESAFLFEHRDALSALGFNVIFLGQDAEAFWSSAAPILRAMTFNAVMFCIVLVLVLALVVFLYLRQRRKEFAVMRALGVPVKKVYTQLIASVMLCGIPAVVIGGAGGWFFALDRAANTINPFGEIVTHILVDLDISLSIIWLIVLAAIVLAGLLAMTMIGVIRIGRRPVLELLQGSAGTAGNAPAKTSQSFSPDTSEQPSSQIDTISNYTHSIASAGTSKRRGTMRFVFCHIVRSPVKSVLMAVVTLFFVLALGFLVESINRVEAEIDNLYDNTIVNAEITMLSGTNPFVTPRVRRFGDVIRPATINNILDLGITQNEFIEAKYLFSVITPDAAQPETWDGRTEADGRGEPFPLMGGLLGFIGFNDIERFLVHHSRDVADDLDLSWIYDEIVRRHMDGDTDVDIDDILAQRRGSLEIEFTEGFSEADLVFAADSPIPIVLSETVIESLDLNHVYVTSWNGASQTWEHNPAVVIGVHNGYIHGYSAHMFRDAILMPLDAAEYIFSQKGRHEIGFSTFDFEIDPARNRALPEIEQALQNIVERGTAGWTLLRLNLHDEELRVVAGSMEQNLSLLGLLYPVAIAVSVAIGFGLVLLLMLQNAKNAAIMRVLGSTKRRTRAVLCTEQLIVCLCGIIIGLAAVTILGWSIGAAVMLAGLYLAGTAVGSAAGSILVTNRPPLELLQVKE